MTSPEQLGFGFEQIEEVKAELLAFLGPEASPWEEQVASATHKHSSLRTIIFCWCG